jgi:hypothetical protein
MFHNVPQDLNIRKISNRKSTLTRQEWKANAMPINNTIVQNFRKFSSDGILEVIWHMGRLERGCRKKRNETFEKIIMGYDCALVGQNSSQGGIKLYHMASDF